MHHVESSKHIVFIHGLFLNAKSWEHWKQFFQDKGYICHTPSFPFHDGTPAQLRAQINPDLGKLNLENTLQPIAAYIKSLPESPILIGHSIGGLLVQKLINMGIGCAGIAINSAPPAGIFSFKWSFIQSNLTLINPFKGNKVFQPSIEWFHYAFCNTNSLEETKVIMDQYVLPESRNIPRSTLGIQGKVDFKKPHPPLLLIAGELDHIIPPSLNKKNYMAYKDKKSKTDFKVFSGRTHYICGQENWEEVAGFIHQWISDLK